MPVCKCAAVHEPRRVIVPNATDVPAKAAQVLALIRAELPECCRAHLDAPADSRIKNLPPA